MFSRIVVDNFTSFNHFEFNLIENRTDKKAKKLALIYGENSIGKTCLVKCFEFLKRSFVSLSLTEQLSRFFANLKNERNQFEDSFPLLIGRAFDEYRISSCLKRYYKLNANNEMKLQYELIINRKKFAYFMTFSKSAIIQEKLLCNGEIVFSCLSSKIEMADLHFLSDEIKDKLKSNYTMYFGEQHTFLSCVHYLKNNVSSTFFKKSLSKEFIMFLDYIDSMIVVTKDDEDLMFPSSVPNYSSLFLYPISSGNYNEKLKQKLEKTEKALSMYFASLYSNIDSVEYHIEISESGKQTYHLFFNESKNKELLSIPYEMESTGTKKMLFLFTSLFELTKNKKTIVIDEIDNGINDILLKSVFESLDGSIAGQFIVTTHNTLLLRYSIKKNIYILNREESYENVISYSLDEFGRKIQAGTDIIGQYLKGLYGGVPQSGAFSMKYITETLDEYESKD